MRGVQASIMRLLLLLSLVWLAMSNLEHSPYHQHLLDCDKEPTSKFIVKKTKSKGIVCPMVKDKEGFLSEWTAYYEMQGFDHIIFYDNNSTMSFAELDPWVKSGYVEIKHIW